MSDHVLYAELVERARAGVLVYRWEEPPDPGSLRLVISNAASQRLGSSPEQLGKTLRETSPHILTTPVAGYYVKAFQTGNLVFWTIEWPFGDGRVVDYECYCYPLDAKHLVVWFENVSEKLAAERALARQMRELERSNQELDTFAHVASHDLKSPLRDIHNLAQWITEDLGPGLPDGSRRHLGLLQDRIVRMERLLDDLLEYARAGKLDTVADAFSLPQLVADVVALVGAKGIDVEVRGTRSDFPAPRAAVELVIRNLVSNAIHHHDRSSGLVTVSADDAQDGWVKLDVSDDGPGIPREHHERVFRMFQTLTPKEGSGIGLAVVRKVVEAHGGTVELLSGGRGTTVRMMWPPAATA